LIKVDEGDGWGSCGLNALSTSSFTVSMTDQQKLSTDLIPNFTYEELSIGQSARLLRTLTMQDIQVFAAVSGDTYPSQLDSHDAKACALDGSFAHGMWGGALISALLGHQFPGPGSIQLEQDFHFMRPVRLGDTLSVIATVVAKEKKMKYSSIARSKTKTANKFSMDWLELLHRLTKCTALGPIQPHFK
jgi:acyl dehydratase